MFDSIEESVFLGVDELVANNSIAELASLSVAPSEDFAFLGDELDELVAASDLGELLILKALDLDWHELVLAELSSQWAGETQKRFEPAAAMASPGPDTAVLGDRAHVPVAYCNIADLEASLAEEAHARGSQGILLVAETKLTMAVLPGRE